MLVLTRKVGESIMIGDSIRVMVTAVVKGMAKIGIDVPDDVLVDRQEVRDRRDEVADVPCVLPIDAPARSPYSRLFSSASKVAKDGDGLRR